MLAVQPPEEQNSTAPAGEEASPLEEAAVIIFSPPEYNYFELGPWEDMGACRTCRVRTQPDVGLV